MNKKIILSIFACIFIIGASVFLLVDLNNNRDSVKEEVHKEKPVTATEITEEFTKAVEGMQIVSDDTSTPIPKIEEPSLQPFGIIKVPVICGSKEKLDPVKNICRKNI